MTTSYSREVLIQVIGDDLGALFSYLEESYPDLKNMPFDRLAVLLSALFLLNEIMDFRGENCSRGLKGN